MLFKKDELTTPSFQLKKQGLSYVDTPNSDFALRETQRRPPCFLEFYIAVINGIKRRYQLECYKSHYNYVSELQTGLQEFVKLHGQTKKDILLDSFQRETELCLTQETNPRIVMPCDHCQVYVPIENHCKKCQARYYCDVKCRKADAQRHKSECQDSIRILPGILQALQVEIHSSNENPKTCKNVAIYFEHECKLSYFLRGKKLFQGLNSLLLKNKFLRANNYTVKYDVPKCCISINLHESKTKKQGEAENVSEDFLLKLELIQELRVIFLNQGAILQDILQEDHTNFTKFIHIFYFP